MHGNNKPALCQNSMLLSVISSFTALIASATAVSAYLNIEQKLFILLRYTYHMLSPWFCLAVIFRICELFFIHRDFALKSAYQNTRELYLNWKFDFRTTDIMPGAYNDNDNDNDNQDAEAFVLVTSRRRRQQKNKNNQKRHCRQRQRKNYNETSKGNGSYTNVSGVSEEQQPKSHIHDKQESEKKKNMHPTAKSSTDISPSVGKNNKWIEVTNTDMNKMEDDELNSLFETMSTKPSSDLYHFTPKQSIYATVPVRNSPRSSLAVPAATVYDDHQAISWCDVVKNNYNKDAITDRRKQSVTIEAFSNAEVPALTDNESTASSVEESSPILLAQTRAPSFYQYPAPAATTTPAYGFKTRTITPNNSGYSPFTTGFNLAQTFPNPAPTNNELDSFSYYHKASTYLFRRPQYIPSVIDTVDYTLPFYNNTSSDNLNSHEKSILDLLNSAGHRNEKDDTIHQNIYNDRRLSVRKSSFDFPDQQMKDTPPTNIIDNLRDAVDGIDRLSRRDCNRVSSRF